MKQSINALVSIVCIFHIVIQNVFAQSKSSCLRNSDSRANLQHLLSMAEFNDIADVEMPLEFLPIPGMPWVMQYFMMQNILPSALARPDSLCESKTLKQIRVVLDETIGISVWNLVLSLMHVDMQDLNTPLFHLCVHIYFRFVTVAVFSL